MTVKSPFFNTEMHSDNFRMVAKFDTTKSIVLWLEADFGFSCLVELWLYLVNAEKKKLKVFHGRCRFYIALFRPNTFGTAFRPRVSTRTNLQLELLKCLRGTPCYWHSLTIVGFLGSFNVCISYPVSNNLKSSTQSLLYPSSGK
jgi:hypothetical protein